MYYYSTYIFVIIGAALTLAANIYVQFVYRKYSRVAVLSGYTGEETAEKILWNNNVSGVSIVGISGEMTDHYNSRRGEVALSEGVYGCSSVASVAIAAHECGHVIQHETGYIPLKIRGLLVPIANFGSNAGIWIVMLSLFFGLSIELVDLGIFLFSFGVLFQIVTLPVEFNASKRGLVLLQNLGITTKGETRNAKKVLRAAALTYVAAAASSVLQLLRLITLRNRRNR